MPLKAITLAIILAASFYFAVNTYGQFNHDDSAFFSKAPVKYIKLTVADGERPSLPFADVKLVDAREDTSIIGFDLANELGGLTVNKIKFHSPLGLAIPSFIKDAYRLTTDADSTANLVIILKRFWLTNSIPLEETQTQDAAEWVSGTILKADLFVEKAGVYHTLYRIDTVLAADYDLNAYNYRIYATLGIEALLSKAANQPLLALRAGKKNFSQAEIDDYVNSLAIAAPSLRKKGIFLTFDEFLSNTPSIPDFSFRQDAKADIMYAKDANGSEYVLRDYWGCCDGEHFYILSSGNLFQLCPSGNTFNVLGFKSMTKLKRVKVGNVLTLGLLGGMVGKQNKNIIYKGKKRPLQIDMSSGELF